MGSAAEVRSRATAPVHADAPPILVLDRVTKHFPVRRRRLVAVDDVSLSIRPGETLGVVGESGSGKSTLARLVLRLIDVTSGTVRFEGRDITRLGHSALMPVRDRMQVMFQDSRASLDPRMTVEASIAEPLVIRGKWDAAGRARVAALMERVGLGAHQADRYPHEFSGGQQQRIGLARALVLDPALLVLDEPTSSLDVSIRAQIVNLLLELQNERGLTYLFIAHDLSLVRHISDRIAVMYLGRVVEIGDAEAVCDTPLHPYTQALVRSIPEPDPSAPKLPPPALGDLPDPMSPPPGCPFHRRCTHALGLAVRPGADPVEAGGRKVPRRCAAERPETVERLPGRAAACHFPLTLD